MRGAGAEEDLLTVEEDLRVGIGSELPQEFAGPLNFDRTGLFRDHRIICETSAYLGDMDHARFQGQLVRICGRAASKMDPSVNIP